MENKTNLKSSLNWDKLIEEYRTSRISAEKWCVEHGLKVNQLRYQIFKRSEVKKEVISTNLSFIPVEVIPELENTLENTTSISLRIGVFELCILENFNPNLLAAVIKTLQPLC